MGVPLAGEERGGLFGFETRIVLCAFVKCQAIEVGSIAYGGDAQRGRWLLQLTGRGSSLVRDWDGIGELLQGCNGTITRVDLAVDFLNGEYTVDDAVRMREEGGFNCSGREPSSSVAGDWLDGCHGRTLYIGKSQNGKMLRVYEKGKEQGNLDSEWVRFEVQLGNRDRVIPFEILESPEKFFAGAYPALEQLLEQAAEKIPTDQNESKVTLGHLLSHLRRCYGKVIGAVLSLEDASSTDLIEEMRLVGLPRRVDPAGVVSGLSWPEIKAELRSRTQ
ncbi:MAG: hypothetical protein JWN73_42 [Betaproteobacteria bacterium]|nr:hypothetical protein [Betaproteobacteria bacterium]